jgi:hypothetical protein
MFLGARLSVAETQDILVTVTNTIAVLGHLPSKVLCLAIVVPTGDGFSETSSPPSQFFAIRDELEKMGTDSAYVG